MRLRLMLPLTALLCLACGGLFGSKGETPAAPSAAPSAPATSTPAASAGGSATASAGATGDGPPKETVPVPYSYQSESPLAMGEQNRGQSGRVQSSNVTVVGPEIPEGTQLAEVKTDYEYLHDSGKLDACPVGTTQQEKKRGDNHSVFCGLSNGVRHGPWIDYWQNGVVKEIGPYVAGYRQGTFTTWDQKGKLTSRYVWKDGQPVSGRVFD